MNSTEQHLTDLAQRAYERNYNTYSEFLNLEEISKLYRMKPAQSFILFGGYENAERCIACFFTDENEIAFPIKCIKITPSNPKFADKLSHRDYLGSLMNLGINRNTIGDIIVNDGTAYLFCLTGICDYIIQNLSRIKHTTVKCEVVDSVDKITANEPEEIEINVSSLRADAVCASLYKLSRSCISECFKSSKVFINSRLCEKESTILKSGDRVTLRGYGKFIFDSEIRQTKRGRTVICVKVYK